MWCRFAQNKNKRMTVLLFSENECLTNLWRVCVRCLQPARMLARKVSTICIARLFYLIYKNNKKTPYCEFEFFCTLISMSAHHALVAVNAVLQYHLKITKTFVVVIVFGQTWKNSFVHGNGLQLVYGFNDRVALATKECRTWRHERMHVQAAVKSFSSGGDVQ